MLKEKNDVRNWACCFRAGRDRGRLEAGWPRAELHAAKDREHTARGPFLIGMTGEFATDV